MKRENVLMIPKAEGGYLYIVIKAITKFKEPLRILRFVDGAWTEEQTPFFEARKEWENLATFTAFEAGVGKNHFVAARRESENEWLFLERRGNKFRMWQGERENVFK